MNDGGQDSDAALEVDSLASEAWPRPEHLHVILEHCLRNPHFHARPRWVARIFFCEPHGRTIFNLDARLHGLICAAAG